MNYLEFEELANNTTIKEITKTIQQDKYDFPRKETILEVTTNVPKETSVCLIYEDGKIFFTNWGMLHNDKYIYFIPEKIIQATKINLDKIKLMFEYKTLGYIKVFDKEDVMND